MFSLKCNVTEFIHQIHLHKDVNNLRDQFQTIITRFGYDNFIMASVPGGSQQTVNNAFCSTWPEAWVRQYREMEYQRYDAVIHYSLLAERPFYWNEAQSLDCSKSSREMEYDAKSHGLCDGILFPLYNSRVGHHLISLASANHVANNPAIMGILYLITSHFSAAVSKRLSFSESPKCDLPQSHQKLFLS